MASQATETETKRPTGSYVQHSKLVTDGFPSVYQLPLQKVTSENKGDSVKYRFGEESPKRNVKTIMLLGATGAGKTTLTNTMINYILGVEWEDPFRYKLIHEETSRSQAKSQTSSVTPYEISHQEGFRIPYSLIIVDTPGYGDTRGVEQDKLITQQIREFFTSPHGVDQIDAVCFVVPAGLARLTPAQKYTFDSILDIFGKDIAENICVLVTFADGQVPPALQALKESDFPFPKNNKGQPIHFNFNNSATFAQTGPSGDCHGDDDDENFDQMFWKMGSTNMKRFFAALDTMTPKSLRLTKEVLQERKQLDVVMRGLKQQIKDGLIKMEEIKRTREQLCKHESEGKKSENFEVEVPVTKIVVKDISGTGQQATNCQNCKFTCDYPCICTDWLKYFCAAMDWKGYCKVCPGKCASRHHKLEHHKYDRIIETEKRTYEHMKAKYEKASGEEMTREKLKEKLQEELVQIEDMVLELVETLTGCLARLDEIALKPNPLSNLDYINLMIEEEKQERKPGFTERIQSLNDAKNNIELLAKVTNGEKLSEEQNKKYKRLQRAKESRSKRVKPGVSSDINDGDDKPTSPKAGNQ